MTINTHPEVVVVRQGTSVHSPHYSRFRITSCAAQHSEAITTRYHSTGRCSNYLGLGNGRRLHVVKHKYGVGIVATGVAVTGAGFSIFSVRVESVWSCATLSPFEDPVNLRWI